MIDIRITDEAILRFGAESQTHKAVEELTELSLALQHALDGRANIDNICEEIADVEIMCAQLRTMYGNDTVEEWQRIKVKRLADIVTS